MNSNSNNSFPRFSISDAISDADLQAIENMAREIIPEVYGAYVPLYHLTYFIENYQTVASLQKQLQQGFLYYLLSFDGQIQGYLALQFQSETALLSKLYLLSAARGKGMGQLALNFALAKTSEIGHNSMELFVNRQNLSSIAFYERNGFEIVETLERDFGNGTLVFDYRMLKKL